MSAVWDKSWLYCIPVVLHGPKFPLIFNLVWIYWFLFKSWLKLYYNNSDDILLEDSFLKKLHIFPFWWEICHLPCLVVMSITERFQWLILKSYVTGGNKNISTAIQIKNWIYTIYWWRERLSKHLSSGWKDPRYKPSNQSKSISLSLSSFPTFSLSCYSDYKDTSNDFFQMNYATMKEEELTAFSS